MSRLCQHTFTLTVVLSLVMLVLVPMGFGVTTAHQGSPAAALPSVAATGPTLPPLPWDGMTGPTLPPLPWDGIV
jgi:hypothetical protein